MAGIFHNRIKVKADPPTKTAEKVNIVFNRIPTCQKTAKPAESEEVPEDCDSVAEGDLGDEDL